MEENMFNVVSLKIASMLTRVKLNELVVLTVDGSPHCVQLHHAVEEARKISGEANIVHMVEHNGKVFTVSSKVVKTSRYLYKISRILGES